MSQPSVDGRGGDPWRAFGHVVSGVAVYGLLGWLADRWLDTGFLVAVGIVLGAGLGIYATQASLAARRRAQQPEHQDGPERPDQQDE